MKKSAMTVLSVMVLLNLTSIRSALAGDFTGKVEMLEVWENGNIAVSLTPAIVGCNAQVILNQSRPGTKNLYAALLAAKHADRAVRIYTNGCGIADGYGGSYNLPLYIYVL
jgi:hypothetical protein